MFSKSQRGIYFLLICLLPSCSTPIEDRLIGEWRLDSAYYFYNNFHYTRDGWHQEEIYEFTIDGVAYTKAVNAYVSNRYVVDGKSLVFHDETGSPFNTYEILKLTEDLLALKTNKAPLFQGPNQTRYEVRYFSKVEGLDSSEKDFP